MWRRINDRVAAGGSGRPLNSSRAVVSPHLSLLQQAAEGFCLPLSVSDLGVFFRAAPLGSDQASCSQNRNHSKKLCKAPLKWVPGETVLQFRLLRSLSRAQRAGPPTLPFPG